MDDDKKVLVVANAPADPNTLTAGDIKLGGLEIKAAPAPESEAPKPRQRAMPPARVINYIHAGMTTYRKAAGGPSKKERRALRRLERKRRVAQLKQSSRSSAD